MAEDSPFVSRGGLKLAAALDAFEINPVGRACADLGTNVGGFTDCLLQRGAGQVYAVDTGYGTLDWRLRNDERVTVLERTNAMHFDPGDLESFNPVSLVVIDLGWTPQRHAVPAALRWLDTDDPTARIVTLIKPQYEAPHDGDARGKRRARALDDDTAQRVCDDVLATLPELGVRLLGCIRSPVRGGGSRSGKGNVEFLAQLAIK